MGLLTIISPPVAWAQDHAVPGPYEVGFAFFVDLDATRQHVSGSARPVPIGVFYPSDAKGIVGAPPARYPRNPFVNAATAVFLSTDFEARGLDAVRHQPAPAESGPFPLLVISPGARAPYWYNIGVAARVASHGFVVAVMAHYGEAAYAVANASDPLFHVAQRGLDRIFDMKLVIDRLLLRGATPGDLLFGLVDGDRVAAGGHSFGGLTAIQLVGGDDVVCDTYPAGANPPSATCVPFTAIDHRVKALILFDASSQNMKWSELHRVSVPAISIGEDPDSIIAGFGGAIPDSLGARAHHAFDGQPSYRVDVLHTRHVPSFTNACESVLVRGDLGLLTPVQVQAELNRLQCNDPGLTPYATAEGVLWRYAIAFGQTELAGESGFQNVLTPGWAITREPHAQFFVTEKREGLTPEVEFPDDEWFFGLQPGIDMDMPVVFYE